MNMFKKIICAGLMGFISMVGLTNVSAMEAKDATGAVGQDIESIARDFSTTLVGHLNDSIEAKNFDKFFQLNPVTTGDSMVYERYCTAVVKLLYAGACSEENIQRIFNEILKAFTKVFWTESFVSKTDRPTIKQTLLTQLGENNSISKTLDACLDNKQFAHYCATEGSTLTAAYGQLAGKEKTLDALFASDRLKQALTKLKKDLIAMLDKEPASFASFTREQKAPESRFAWARKKATRGIFYATPALLIMATMAIGRACCGEKPLNYGVVYDSIIGQFVWECGKSFYIKIRRK